MGRRLFDDMTDKKNADFDDTPMAHYLSSFFSQQREKQKRGLKQERKEKLELVMLIVSTIVGVLGLIVTIISIFL